MKPPPVASFYFTETLEEPVRHHWWSRPADLLLSSLLLVLLGPLFLVVAAFVKLVSEGPLLFKQERVGYRGKSFMILKFRTMHVDSCTAPHEEHTAGLIKRNAPMTKLDAHGDSRLIPFGRFIRAAGLDELPQLLNVFKGDMRIIGPRPCLPSERAACGRDQLTRFSVRPGITGLWQVSGKNSLTFSQMIELDEVYVRSQSAWLDLRIMAKTPGVLLQQLAAEFAGGGKRRKVVLPGEVELSNADRRAAG